MRAGSPNSIGNHGQFADFAEGFDVDQDARRDRLAQFATALAGAGKADFRRIRTGIQRHFKLPSRSDIDAIDQARHDTDQRRHRVGFHCVVQLDGLGEGSAQLGNALNQQLPVIGIERCLADLCSEAFQRHATDQQLTGDCLKLAHRRVNRKRAFRKRHRYKPLGNWQLQLAFFSTHSVDSVLRSIFPFGLRGNGPMRTSIPAGTM